LECAFGVVRKIFILKISSSVDEIDKLEKIHDVVETFNISDYSTTVITNEFYNISNVTSHMDQIQPHA
jgi:hypothetical protein